MGVNSCGVVMQTPLPLFSLLLLLVPSRGQSTNKPEPDDKIATYVTFLTIFLMAVVCKKNMFLLGTFYMFQFCISKIISKNNLSIVLICLKKTNTGMFLRGWDPCVFEQKESMERWTQQRQKLLVKKSTTTTTTHNFNNNNNNSNFPQSTTIASGEIEGTRKGGHLVTRNNLQMQI